MKKFAYCKNFKYFVVVLLTLTVIGMVMLGVLGFNRSADYKNTYEIRIEATETFGTSGKAMKDAAEKVFKNNKVKYVSYKEADDGAVIIYELNEAVAGSVLTSLETEVGAALSSFNIDVEVSGYPAVAHKGYTDAWWALLAAGVLLVAALVYLAIRYKWAASFAVVISVIAYALLAVALTALTRVPVTTAYLAVLLSGTVLVIGANVFMFSNIKEYIRNGSTNAGENADKAFADCIGLMLGALIAIALVVAALLIFGGMQVKFAALQILICALAAAFVVMGITLGLYALLAKIRLGKSKK